MENRYIFSFVAGGLLEPETHAILQRYAEIGDWAIVRQEIETGSLLQATRAASRIRYYLEIRRRLKVAHPFEIEFIMQQAPGHRLANFALCCRYYEFLGDFVLTVVREKIDHFASPLALMDIYGFMEDKVSDHPEIAALTDQSRRKIQQVTLRMLAEAGIMDATTKVLTTPHVPVELIQAYWHSGDQKALLHLLQRRTDLDRPFSEEML